MNNLRVAFLGGYSANTAQIHGGVQAATAYLLKGLKKIDSLELHILTYQPVDWEGPDHVIQNGFQVHFLPPYPRLQRLRGYHDYQLTVNLLLGKINPILIHAQEASADALVALRSGYPTVVTAHGIRAEDAKYYHSWKKRVRFYIDSALIERNVMKRTKYLIAISRYVTNYFSHLLRPDVHVAYIPNAVDECFFERKINFLKPVILFVGRVIPRKRVLDLLQAFKIVSQQNPQAELRIAGEFTSEPAYVQAVQTEMQQAILTNRVNLLGELCQTDLLCEYNTCSLVVLPSAQETTPMVLAQAMAAGKPSVATPVGGIPEMLGQNGERGLLVNVGDINGLAAAINLALQNKQLWLDLAQAASAYAWENYHYTKVAQKTFEFYQQIVEAERLSHV